MLAYATILGSYIGPINILVLIAVVCCVAQTHRKSGIVLTLLFLLHEAQQIHAHPNPQAWILTNFTFACAVYLIGILINLVFTNKNNIRSQQILQQHHFHKFLHDEICGPLSKLIVRLELMKSCKEKQFISHQQYALSTAREIAQATRQTMDITQEDSTPKYTTEGTINLKQNFSIATIVDAQLNELQSYGLKIEKNIITKDLNHDETTACTFISLINEITTNTVKYADISEPVKIEIFEQPRGFLVRSKNLVRTRSSNYASDAREAGTGLKMLAAELQNITGTLNYSINKNHFELTGYIPKSTTHTPRR